MLSETKVIPEFQQSRKAAAIPGKSREEMPIFPSMFCLASSRALALSPKALREPQDKRNDTRVSPFPDVTKKLFAFCVQQCVLVVDPCEFCAAQLLKKRNTEQQTG